VISGFPDHKNESEQEIYDSVCELIRNITNESNMLPDVVHRVENLNEGKCRAIRVKFISVRERNKVYESRENTAKSIYINDDLSYTVRRDQALLRRKRRELNENGIKSDIDYKSKTLTTEKGDKFVVVDGIIKRCQPQQSQSESSGHINSLNKCKLEENQTDGVDKAPKKKAKTSRDPRPFLVTASQKIAKPNQEEATITMYPPNPHPPTSSLVRMKNSTKI